MADVRARLAGWIFAAFVLMWSLLVFYAGDDKAAFFSVVHEVTVGAWAVFLAYLQPPKDAP